MQGVLQEITVGKSGTNARGAWTMYGAKIGDVKYGTGFEKVRAAVGDTVEFDVEEKGDFKNVAKGSFKVVKKATSQESAAVSSANAGSEVNKQDSIERSVLLKCAVELAVVEGGIGAVAKNYAVLSGILHPAAKAVAKPKPVVVVEEDDSEDLPGY